MVSGTQEEIFYAPYTWASENKDEYVEVLMDWIMSNDHFYDLYRYFADCKRNGEAHNHTLQLEKLYHKFLDEDGDECGVEFYDGFYQKEIQEYESWKEDYESSKKETERNKKIIRFKKK